MDKYKMLSLGRNIRCTNEGQIDDVLIRDKYKIY